jgi:hypothetical protein
VVIHHHRKVVAGAFLLQDANWNAFVLEISLFDTFSNFCGNFSSPCCPDCTNGRINCPEPVFELFSRPVFVRKLKRRTGGKFFESFSSSFK